MKHYNIQNYIRYKKDVEVTIKKIEGKMWHEYTRGELVTIFLPLVENLARKFATSQQASGVMAITDLIQEGSLNAGTREDDDMFLQIEDKSEPYNQEFLNIYLTSLLKQHLTDREYHVLRMSYGLDCDKHSAKEIAKHLKIEGTGAYVRISQLKKQAVDKLIDNVDHSQVFEYL